MKINYNTRYNIINLVVQDIFSLIKSNIVAGEKTLIALSGGSTPIPIYQSLASKLKELPMNTSEFVLLTQVDERFVKSSSNRSNQRMIREIFGELVGYEMMPVNDGNQSLEEAVVQFDLQLSRVFNTFNQIDLSILGMGTDGHTASLFPFNSDYLTSKELNIRVIAVEDDSVPESRISLTSRLINQSKHKILIIFGEKKAKVLSSALAAQDQNKYPILSVLENSIIYTDTELI